MTSGSRRRVLAIASTVLAMAVAAIYHNACAGAFVFDNAPILADYRLRDPAHLPLILLRDYWFGYSPSRLWRPLTTLSYFLNYTVLGNHGNPFGYHVVNIVLHALNVLLLLRLVDKLAADRWLAIGAAALFAVHPIATESVTNIVGRADLLATCGVLASLLLAARGRVWLAQLAFAFALLGKESAVVAPAWWAAWLLLQPMPAAAPHSRVRACVRGVIPYAITLTLYLAMRTWVLRGIAETYLREENFLIGLPWITQRLTAIKAFCIGLSRLVFPARLSADYSFDQVPAVTSLCDPWLLAGSGALLGAILLLLRARDPVLRGAVAFALIGYLPVSNLLFVIGTGLGERLFYLPAVGFVVVVALAVRGVIARLRFTPRVAALALVPILALLAARTYARNGVWLDTLTFWETTVRDAPRSVRALRTLARVLLMRASGDVGRPIELLERAVAIAPDEVETRASLGLALARRAELHLQSRETVLAAADLERAERELGPARAAEARATPAPGAAFCGSAELARAEAFLAIAKHDAARAEGQAPAPRIEWFLRKAVALEPGYATYSLELAGLLLGMGRPEDSAAAVLGLLLVDPSPPELAAKLLAQAYRAARLPVEAFFDLQNGIRMQRSPRAAGEQLAKHERILQAAFASTIRLLRAGSRSDYAARILATARRSGMATPLVEAAWLAPLDCEQPWTRYDEVPWSTR